MGEGIERVRMHAMETTRIVAQAGTMLSEVFHLLEQLETLEDESGIVAQQLEVLAGAIRQCNPVWHASVQLLTSLREVTAVLMHRLDTVKAG